MKQIFFSILTAACLQTVVRAQAVPPPDRLLPADTLGVFTVPDMAAARRLFHEMPQTQLWSEPSLQPFVDKFWGKLDAELLRPFESEMGINLTNIFDLAQGQVTVAITRNGWPAQPGATPGLIVLVDSRDRAARVSELLTQAREKLASGNEPVTTTNIAGTNFTVLRVTPPAPPAKPADDDHDQNEPNANGAAGQPTKPASHDFYVGQSGTLFIAGSSALDLEKVLRLQTGGAVLALSESTSFMPDYKAMFNDATIYGWFNFEPVVAAAGQALSGAPSKMPMGLNPGRILTAVGLGGLKTIAFAGRWESSGGFGEFSVRVPESARRGLLRMMEFEAKDATPPPYVPADALAFSRTRIDLMRAWNTLEAMLMDVSPQVGGIVRMSVDGIGKDKDSSFDFRTQFVGNLGDDAIAWQVQPEDGKATATGSPPQVALISSPKPGELAASIKTLMGMIPPDVAKLEESEIAGTKVWSIAVPMGVPNSGQSAPPMQTFAFAAARGYLALATDLDLLKSFLEGKAPADGSLITKPGLQAAANKVGGFSTGMFGYSNDRLGVRSIWDAVTDKDLSAINPTALMLRQLFAAAESSGKGVNLNDWVDFSLLPPFEKVEKYFYISVYAGSVGPDGFTLKTFAPTPPGL